jgi:hypothetical protein
MRGAACSFVFFVWFAGVIGGGGLHAGLRLRRGVDLLRVGSARRLAKDDNHEPHGVETEEQEPRTNASGATCLTTGTTRVEVDAHGMTIMGRELNS